MEGLHTVTPLVLSPQASLLVLTKGPLFSVSMEEKTSCASLLPVAEMEHGPEALRWEESV